MISQALELRVEGRRVSHSWFKCVVSHGYGRFGGSRDGGGGLWIACWTKSGGVGCIPWFSTDDGCSLADYTMGYFALLCGVICVLRLHADSRCLADFHHRLLCIVMCMSRLHADGSSLADLNHRLLSIVMCVSWLHVDSQSLADLHHNLL